MFNIRIRILRSSSFYSQMATAFNNRLLIDLPTEVATEVLHCWLDLWSLARADTAHCSHRDRPILLGFLAFNGSNSKRYVQLDNAGCAQWLIMRKVWFSGVDIASTFPEVSRYLRFCQRFNKFGVLAAAQLIKSP